ncbi:AMP-binding protein [Mycolicibacterium goodii]|uniref:AMP-binding protein n=1 Tax=Mycolicibacterium goodii TaxID=134601 RepID=UPI001F04AF4A|nr:AMP-binding protein [Mycolicibacterium goodii]ULN49590.1 AMP-binding protein [Mycolicibacterium goodii]
MSDYVWWPSPERIAEANVTRLANRHGIDSLTELRRRSVGDVRWYWDAAIDDLAIPFRSPYRQVLDTSRGKEHSDWFVGSEFTIVDACLTRWADSLCPAIIHEAEDGRVEELSFAELSRQVAALAAGLNRIGVTEGDTVALYLPMIPEAVVAFYAAASIGAIVVPLFSGFAAPAISARLNDAGVTAVIVADATIRRGRRVDMAAEMAAAVAAAPSVTSIVTVANVDEMVTFKTDNLTVTSWTELLAGDNVRDTARAFPAMQTLMLGYTSGTTGTPKGAVHTHAGFTVKVATEMAYSFDVAPNDRVCWVTDMGWVMGPFTIVGAHANGATLVLYEGSPDAPDTLRLWELVERHSISTLGLSPTLIRALRDTPLPTIRSRDLKSVRTLGSTGEPWDPDSYDWLAVEVFDGRVPIINISGGTEVGGSFLAPYPVEPIASCSLGGPSLGMDVDVVDGNARSVRGGIGELVCRTPWPSMTRSVWRDHDRYLQSYWSTFDGVWCHGDFALVDTKDGAWYILGRSDDVMNVAGKRLAPAEVESVLTSHPGVAEAAAIGVPDPKKGETIWVFWVPREGADSSSVSAELRAAVADNIGKPFAPNEIIAVSELPKTRSAKIMRRAIRAVATGADPGDLSSAENPAALDRIRAVLADAHRRA